MELFNPNWISNGYFADGYFGGVKADIFEIDKRYDDYKFAQVSHPHLWNQKCKEILEQHYKAAILKAQAIADEIAENSNPCRN